MHAIQHTDLAALLSALFVCAVFGALFAFVLAVPFWLGFAMVGASQFALGLAGDDGARPARPSRRRAALLDSVTAPAAGRRSSP